MGQKVNPIAARLKITRTWDSSWYASDKNYSDNIITDYKIREYLNKRFKESGVSQIQIGRNSGKIIITIFTSKPGMIIGRQWSEAEQVRLDLSKKFGHVELTIKEEKKPMLSAILVSDNIAAQIERRTPYRRAVKQAIEKAMQAGAKGVKVKVGGRLNGVEIARREVFKEGNIPLQTLRSVIDYYNGRAETTYGTIGIKVWIYTGQHFKKES